MDKLNERIFEAYRSTILEAKTMTVDEFMKALDSEIRKIFPKSFIRISASTNLGASIWLVFALGKDKSEFTNGIIENDPLLHKIMIGWNSFAEGHFIKDKIVAELSQGGSLTVDPAPGSRYFYDRVKIGWRKKTATPEKMVKSIGDYFRKMKKVTKDNWDRVPEKDREMLKNKI
jgi:hypothetical protein